MADSAPSIDKEREQTEKKLSEKIKRKTRLVKFEKTRQGSTVIHRQVDLPTRVCLLPQRANYEEHLQLSPPIIQVDNAIRSSLDEINTLPFQSQRSSNDGDEQQSFDYQNRKSRMTLPQPSIVALSPIEEESEEIEPTDGIAFSLTKQDSPTKTRFIDTYDEISGILDH